MDTLVSVRLSLPDTLVDKMESLAKSKNISLEDFLAHKLFKYQDDNSAKPIVLNDEERQQIERTVGRNVSSSTELVAAITKAMSVQAGGVDIGLTPFLLDRLHSRCIGMDFDKFMQLTVKRALEEFAGLR